MTFTPIDLEALTVDLKRRFLDAYSSTGTVREACDVVGVPATTAYGWRKGDAKFRLEWDTITHVDILPVLEQRAIERATQNGGEILLMFLMKAYNRKMYDDRASAEKPPETGITMVFQEVTKDEHHLPDPASADEAPQEPKADSDVRGRGGVG